jgi:putative oxidoreductase
MRITMSMTDAEASPRWKRIALWNLKGLVAAVFLAAGGAKLYGVPMLVEEFEHIGLGQWFRYLTGLLEVAGAIGLLIPTLSAMAAVLLGGVMIGATATHLLLIGGSPVPAIVLLVTCAGIAFAERARLIVSAQMCAGRPA